MPLNFPRRPDVRLLRSPLTEVVCQVRYPTILRIANEDPAAFQERVRRRFPRFEREEEFLFQLQFMSGGITEPPPVLPPSRLYRFRTIDEHTAITLTTDFYALSTTKYTVWEDFAQDLTMVHEAVQQVYQPSFAVRIGLRYVDHIVPSKLGLATFDEVVDLFRPELTTLLRVGAWDTPKEMLCQLLLDDQDGTLGFRFGKRLIDEEPTFVLDFDYYDDREQSFGSLIERFDRYHDTIYHAFRWCIQDDKLQAFQPMAKED